MINIRPRKSAAREPRAQLRTAPSNRRPDPHLSDSTWEMFSMKGKVVSITGGSDEIGFEVARAMAEAVSDVAICYNFFKLLIMLHFFRRRIMSKRRRILM